MTITVAAPKPMTLEEANAHKAALGEALTELNASLKVEEDALASATQRYNQACRDLAANKGGDPSTFKAEIDKRTDRILGLKSLIDDRKKEWDQLAPQLQHLNLQLVKRQEAEELTRLKGIQLEKQAAFETAQKALDAAERAKNASNYAVDQHRRQCELRQKRRERGLQ